MNKPSKDDNKCLGCRLNIKGIKVCGGICVKNEVPIATTA